MVLLMVLWACGGPASTSGVSTLECTRIYQVLRVLHTALVIMTRRVHLAVLACSKI
jgi:hypothetical protein